MIYKSGMIRELFLPFTFILNIFLFGLTTPIYNQTTNYMKIPVESFAQEDEIAEPTFQCGPGEVLDNLTMRCEPRPTEPTFS